VRQQYGFGYGRLDLVAKHRGRLTGDSVSPAMMMAHPVITAVALGLLASAGVLPAFAPASLNAGILLLVALAAERAWVGARAARRFGDWVPLLFPVVHFVRDLLGGSDAAGSFAGWRLHHLRHSMQPRRRCTAKPTPDRQRRAPKRCGRNRGSRWRWR
jgi:hypothetical protein